MKTWLLLCLCIATALAVAALSVPAVGQYVYTEDFSTTVYKDASNTTAWWDTLSGELKLPPFQLTYVGSYDTPGYALDVAVYGDYAYVADYTSGLQVIDISDPALPSLLGSYDTPESAQGLWIDGDLAYVCDDGSGLLIIDVSNPAMPSLVGTYDTSGRAFGVEVAGGYAYVADGAAGLTVIDVSNPSVPSLAGSYDTPGFARTIDVEGNYAYIADRAGGGLQIIDISDPTLPTLAGSYDPGADTWGVEVSGNVAYLGATSVGLVAVDITDPSNPTLLGTVSAGSARQLDVEGDYVYVAGYGALYVIDVSDPSNPVSVDSYTTPGIASDVAVAGEHAFVADGTDGGLQVIDICDAVSLPLVGSCYTPGSDRGITVAGDYAYIASSLSGLQVVDISDPTSPATVGGYNTTGSSIDVAVSGDYAYVADYSDGLMVIDISDPTNPSLAGTYDTLYYNAYGVAVSGDYAHIAYEYLGLMVIDISDPTSPSPVGGYDTPGEAYHVAVSGNYAYVADGGSGLQVIDISDPTSPSFAGSYDTPGDAAGVTIAGDYAYMADGGSGLQVIDISDPTSPSLAGSYDTPAYAVTVAVAGDYACLADYAEGAGGLFVFDISDPTNPTLIGTNDTVDEAVDVALAGDYAFVAPFAASSLKVIWIFERFVDAGSNTGQSVQVNSSSYEIEYVNLLSAQSDSIRWEVSANGGTNWQEVPPNASMNLITVPGIDLRWRSTHMCSQPGVNPTCSNLVIKWFSTSPIINTITDIPNDQGRQVSIAWTRSGFDYVGSATPVIEYAIYRKIDDGLSMSPDSKGSGTDGDDLPARVNESHSSLAYPPGDWHYLMTVPADCEDAYAAVVSTLADSSVTEGMYYTTFFVSALTASPGVYFDSPPDSGYSVDNLAPAAPMGFAVVYHAESGNELTWEECPDEDFQYVHIYRSETEDFDPTPGNLVHTTAGTDWLDTVEDGWKYYYKITSVDGAGNESTPASPVSTSDTEVPDVPDAFTLYQNVPNPFNPTTTIRFDLPVRSRVRLAVYNVKGQLVRVLLDSDLEAGTRDVVWDGRDIMGRAVASGIYFYRLYTPTFTESRKMILLR
ncbi:MAG: T9SS type A sorting domain-containing protein [bacterium]|nr:MAG: T9SS type A sorting domain-containing protein [bacterium]